MEVNVINPEEIKNDLITFFKNRSLIPIVGSGVSCGAITRYGKVPSGIEYKNHMIESLSKNPQFNDAEKQQFKKESFSNLCDYYEDDENVSKEERFKYLKTNFYDASLDENDCRKKLFEIGWPYIYSLNIDDAIEKSSDFKTRILPYRDLREDIFNEEKCLIKLHGDICDIVSYNDGEKIFTSKNYALSLERNAPLLNKLRNDYANQNILFIGCSLDDEIDLKTISNIPVDHQKKDSLRKTIIFTKGIPGKLLISKYKTYGITHVVYFDDFDDMYKLLIDAWNESLTVQTDELNDYRAISISYLKREQKEENQDYFFWGKGLLDIKCKKITYPYFFISRNEKSNIIRRLVENKVHLLYGGRISGKTYLLADLYRSIRDREVFYFDGKLRISNFALINLMECTNIVVLLDVGSLNREQFEIILKSAKKINLNKNNFVINVNINDSDTLGMVKWKLKQGIIDSADINSFNLNGKFLSNESVAINKLFPPIYLPLYSEERTFLDQIIYAEKTLKKEGKYDNVKIKVDNVKQLAFLIVLAIKEKLYSSDITSFVFDQEVSDALKKYSPFIERVEVYNFEKSNSDLSTVKYVLNSKYWLRRELGNYAQMPQNYDMISKAYQYVIQKLIESSGGNEYKKRRKCRDFILFDVMNDIFLNRKGVNIKLIVYVYKQLHGQLSDDYHFLHQNAKCFINYSYVLSDIDGKMKYLNDAKDLAILSRSIIEKLYNDYNNERLLISMAHVQYTLATIFSEICRIEDYTNIENISATIREINEAIYSPYNNDEYLKEQKQSGSRGIVRFIKETNENVDKLNISDEIKTELIELTSSNLIQKYGNSTRRSRHVKKSR